MLPRLVPTALVIVTVTVTGIAMATGMAIEMAIEMATAINAATGIEMATVIAMAIAINAATATAIAIAIDVVNPQEGNGRRQLVEKPPKPSRREACARLDRAPRALFGQSVLAAETGQRWTEDRAAGDRRRASFFSPSPTKKPPAPGRRLSFPRKQDQYGQELSDM